MPSPRPAVALVQWGSGIIADERGPLTDGAPLQTHPASRRRTAAGQARRQEGAGVTNGPETPPHSDRLRRMPFPQGRRTFPLYLGAPAVRDSI